MYLRIGNDYWSGEAVRITLPDDSVQQRSYDAAGLLVEQRYREAVSRWRRNARGQVLEALDSAGRQTLCRYDPQGRLVELKTGPATRSTFEHDAGERLAREVRPDGVERLLHYDAAGRLAEIEKLGAAGTSAHQRPRRTTRFECDPLGRLLARSTATAITR